MEFIPALDLLAARSVRLIKGDYQQVTTYGDPRNSVSEFVSAGVSWIHLVDLDAARNQGSNNRSLIAELICLGGADFEVGGGIRSLDDASELFHLGVKRLILGTKAVSDIEFFELVARRFEGFVAAGLDYRRIDGRRICALNGWLQDSDVELETALERVIDGGAAAVILTDISKDGTLVGPDIETYAEFAPKCAKAGVDMIASGGVSSLDDLESLVRIDLAHGGLAGAISGKAIQEGRFGIKEAVDLCRRFG